VLSNSTDILQFLVECSWDAKLPRGKGSLSLFFVGCCFIIILSSNFFLAVQRHAVETRMF
jgi:hypothetical protein